jgi:hypothetical protein
MYTYIPLSLQVRNRTNMQVKLVVTIKAFHMQKNKPYLSKKYFNENTWLKYPSVTSLLV